MMNNLAHVKVVAPSIIPGRRRPTRSAPTNRVHQVTSGEDLTTRGSTVWQLASTWVLGSLTTGTVAVLLTQPYPALENLGFRPLATLSGGALLGLLALTAILFVGLAVLAWRFAELSWLPTEPRGIVLWAVAVGVAGLAGWGFAATVTFGADFSHSAQLLLAYLGGGLPFALVAAMLLRPFAVNLAAAAVSGVLVIIGLVLVGTEKYGLNAVQLYAYHLALLIGPVGVPL